MTSGPDARTSYEAWHLRAQSEHAKADRPWHDLLFRYLRARDLVGCRVLEIGCGRGELACHLAAGKATPRVLVAADFAESAVRLGRVRATREDLDAICWTVADMQHIPFRDGTFDTVISCETIEHVPVPVEALREIHRVLRPGGCLLMTTPNYFGPFGLYRGYLRLRGRRYTEGDQPICHFTLLPRSALWARRAGFRVRAVDAIGHYVLRPGRLPSEPDLLRRLERWLWPIGLHSIVVASRR
jgi:2-polyprenyl-3-methyl-5-hydroxy-6-metoxy-1,4-benzoquinol methylase